MSYIQAKISCDKLGYFDLSCDENQIRDKFKVSPELAKDLIVELKMLIKMLNSNVDSVDSISLYFEIFNNKDVILMKDNSYKPFSPILMNCLKAKCGINLGLFNIFSAYELITENLLAHNIINKISF